MKLTSSVPALIERNQEGILVDWLDEQIADPLFRKDLVNEGELKTQSQKFVSLFSEAIGSEDGTDIHKSHWAQVREMLFTLTRNREEQGFSPSETATFILSLKSPIFKRLRQQPDVSPQQLFSDVWEITALLDKLALLTMEAFQKSRESLISRQQEDMLELSTPVVKLWNGILA